jgi:uncharacterized protein YmfQ (DUF2313 family)
MVDIHVRRSGEDYGTAFLTLLPRGQAWPKYPGSTLELTCRGLAEYWGYVDTRAADLLENESDPRKTLELLPDWERNWGLPDPCMLNPPTSIGARRLALVAKMTMLGGQSRQFFLDVSNAYGYGNITITEYAPYMPGVSRVGDQSGIYNPGDPDHYRWQLGPAEMRFYWTIHVGSLSLEYFRCNSSVCGVNRLLEIGTAADLECILDKLKPAHTEIVYDYSPLDALDFTQLYNSQYLILGTF